MTPEQKAAYINAQASRAMIEALGMVAENQSRADQGKAPAYNQESFVDLLDGYSLHHSILKAFFDD